MLRMIKQVWRGCGYLPHVGEHPGLLVAVFLIIAGFLAGLKRGTFIGGLVGMAIMFVCVGIPFLYGAYMRAEDNDRIDRNNAEREERAKQWHKHLKDVEEKRR